MKRVRAADTAMPYSSTLLEEKSGESPANARKVVTLKKVQNPATNDLWVPIKAGEATTSMFIDSGCDYTIIPPEFYHESMGRIEDSDINLRAWGAEELLKVKGMVNTTLETTKGAKKTTKVYIVDGIHPEPLLGAFDAKDLGFIKINKGGRDPTKEETASIKLLTPSNIRDSLKIDIITHPEIEKVDKVELEKVMETVGKFKGVVFNDQKIGKIDCEPIHLEYESDFKPEQPRFRNVPINYQPEVSKLLDFLRKQDVIEDVDPKDNYDCVMNVVVTDKKNGSIRMNIDNTPLNHGMKRTKFHVQTPQEIRHDLKEAKIFSEMDMGWGYHQIEIDTETSKRSIFQTHEGIHRMKRLYFGPTASSGLFHSEVRKALNGLKGVTSIHDNILVWGKDYEDHLTNLKECLERCGQKGITLKLEKSSFCLNRIKWFGRIFTEAGVTADTDKLEHIKQMGRPKNTEEVRSLLMACQYNAKFFMENSADKSYEDITDPLRKLLKKGVKFSWDDEEESSYQNLMNAMNNPATLQPYDPSRTTHIVADSSEHGMQGSIYQEVGQEVWVPVDHASRSLTPTEQGYNPIERESLAQNWAMEQFRFYVVGKPFTAWTDHQPLVNIYNKRQRPTSKRISKHRDGVQDLEYEMKYLKGECMPCDFGSRHANSIAHLTMEDQMALGFDHGQDIYIRKMVILNSSPDALQIDEIKEAARKDMVYNQTKFQLLSGGRPPENSVYSRIWKELCVNDDLIVKGHKIVLPNAEAKPGSGNVRDKILEIAHEGHPGATTMKRYLRSRVWFPGIDRRTEDLTRDCIPCQASTETKHRDPLTPTEPPVGVWEELAADHWGPTPEGKFLLVVIDKLSRFPEVRVVTGTSAEANIEAFDSIFTTHGNCKVLYTDNGPPFNGGDAHLLQRYFRWAGIKHKPTISAEDPEANGLAESFMKHLGKIWHTSYIERRDPVAEMRKHLQMVRATPHPTTGKSPASLMYPGREYRTRLPNPIKQPSDPEKEIEEARNHDRATKAKQKAYKDKKSYVKPHSIAVGDRVLLKQRKTKMVPPYDPDPYCVVEVRGHQITAMRRGKTIKRDAQKWKLVGTSQEEAGSSEEDTIDDSDCEGTAVAEATQNPIVERASPVLLPEPVGPRRNPTRRRQPPERLTYT